MPHYPLSQPVAYNKPDAPQLMLNKHPNVAVHKCEINGDTHEIVLFCESHEDITGIPAAHIINVAAMGLQPDDGTEPGVLTESELTAKVHELLTGSQSGSEIWLRPDQYHFLHRTLFKL